MQEGPPPRRPDRPAWRGAALILSADLCWGVSSSLAKLLLNRSAVTPAALTALRVTIAFLVLLSILGPRRGRRLEARSEDLPLLSVVGLVGFAANSYCYYTTLSLTNVATAILLIYLAPIFLALYEGLVLRRWPAPSTLAAIALAVGGCFVLVRGYDPGTLRLNLAGLGFGLTTAGAFATYTVASQRMLRAYDSWTVLLYGFGIGSAAWWVLFPLWASAGVENSARTWSLIVAIALGGTLLPHGLFVRGLTYLPPTHATLLSTMEPVIAAGVAYLVLGETMAPAQYAGGLLVLAAVLLVQLRPEVPAEAG
ncbi:MAG: EamA family transporter [Candidatus Rokubacteria bacterium]|nr:EamA family transporter [Candidatus Rokubacteria bacterium]